MVGRPDGGELRLGVRSGVGKKRKNRVEERRGEPPKLWPFFLPLASLPSAVFCIAINSQIGVTNKTLGVNGKRDPIKREGERETPYIN